MKILVVLILIGIVSCNVLTELERAVVHDLFNRLDVSPKDNLLTEQEWKEIITKDDSDKNGCVTLAEYKAATHVSIDSLNTNMFNHFDHDDDGCMRINDMEVEFNIIDADDDGTANLQEFENQMFAVITQSMSGSVILRALFG